MYTATSFKATCCQIVDVVVPTVILLLVAVGIVFFIFGLVAASSHQKARFT